MLIGAVASRLRFFQASQRAMVGRMLHTCSSPTSRRLTAAAAVATATSFASQHRVAACMPSYPFTAGELDESKTLIELACLLDDGDDSDLELGEELLMLAAEPMQRGSKQEIGPEKLSLGRLRREAAERGTDGDDPSSTLYFRFGFRLSWLEEVVNELQVPEKFETIGGHYFSGEEGVLILLSTRSPRPAGTERVLALYVDRACRETSEKIQTGRYSRASFLNQLISSARPLYPSGGP